MRGNSTTWSVKANVFCRMTAILLMKVNPQVTRPNNNRAQFPLV